VRKLKIENWKLKINNGFTLVELLIVIALIGILSVAVLSTINPIEQTNKARDSAMKNDASEILGALERYYASQSTYPWVGDGVTLESAVGYSAEQEDVGICGANCNTNGKLIDADELKPAFRNKSFLTTDTDVEKVYLYKDTGASASVHVCFVPKSKTFRTDSDTNPLWLLTFTQGVPSGMSEANGNTGSTGSCPPLSGTGADAWGTLDSACFVCVP